MAPRALLGAADAPQHRAALSHDDRHGARLRALIVVLRRARVRVQEALALGERDLDPRRGSLLVRGTGGRREIGMDAAPAMRRSGSPP
jgi:site-specific recombinase XerD